MPTASRVNSIACLSAVFAMAVLVGTPSEAAPNHHVTEILSRKAEIITGQAGHHDVADHPKYKPYDIILRRAERGCVPDDAAYMADVLGFHESPGSQKLTPEVFALPALARYLYEAGDCLSADQAVHVRNFLQERVDFFQHGTTNQALMSGTSWYLIIQKFPTNVWTSASGQRFCSEQLLRQLKKLLTEALQGWIRNGNVEQFSPTYMMVNLIPVVNLAEFCEDKDLRELADAAANVMVAMVRVASFHGLLMPPEIRVNLPQYNSFEGGLESRESVTDQVTWLYFGEPIRRSEDFYTRGEPIYIAILADSKWLPQQEVLELQDTLPKPYRLRTLIPNFGKWGATPGINAYGEAYFTPNYAVGMGTFRFNPGSYNASSSAFAIRYATTAKFNVIECGHLYWSSDRGRSDKSTDWMSPFQEGFLDGARGGLIFSIPDADPWPQNLNNWTFGVRKSHQENLIRVVTCRYPRNLTSVERGDSYAYFDVGSAYIGLRWIAETARSDAVALEPQGDAFTYINVPASVAGLFFRVCDPTECGTFSEFKKTMNDVSLGLNRNDQALKILDHGAQYSITFKLDRQGEQMAALPSVQKDGIDMELWQNRNYVDSPRMTAGPQSVVIRGISTTLMYLPTKDGVRVLRQAL